MFWFFLAPFFIKHLPASVDVMEGFNIQYDCYVEGDITLIKTKQTEMKQVKQTLEASGFEGNYKDIPMMGIPPMATIPEPKPGGQAGRGKQARSSPRFVEGLEDKQFRTGSIAMLSVVVEALPEAEISWYKDGQEIGHSGQCSQVTLIISCQIFTIKLSSLLKYFQGITIQW